MDHLFDVYVYCKEHDEADLYVALAKYINEHPDHISNDQYHDYRKFMARNRKALIAAFKTQNREIFETLVANIVEEEAKEAAEEAAE